MSSVDTACDMVLVFLSTYLVHSTLILGACWLFFRATSIQNRGLADRLWKFAFLAGFATAMVQTTRPAASAWNIVVPTARPTAPENVALPKGLPAAAARANQAQTENWQVHIFVDEAVPNVDAGQTFATDSPAAAIATEGHPQRTDRIMDAEPLYAAVPANLLASITVKRILAAAIVIWAILASTIVVWRSFRCSRRLGSATAITRGRCRRIVDRLCSKSRFRKPIRLLCCDCQTQPIAFGFFRPTILLPSSIETQLGDDELTALLSHEVAHLLRRDVWWLMIGKMLTVSFPVQPLNLLARRRWQSASEYLCDQWAVEQGVSRVSLARCLTKVAAWQLRPDWRRIAVSAAGSKSTLVGRVASLLADEPTEKPWKLAQQRRFNVLVAALAAAFALIAPSVRWTSADSRAITDNRLEASDRVAQWEALSFELRALDQEIDRVSKMLGRMPDEKLKQVSVELELKRSLLMQRHELLQQRKKESNQ